MTDTDARDEGFAAELEAVWAQATAIEPARGKVESSAVIKLRDALEHLAASHAALGEDDGDDGTLSAVYARCAAVAIAAGDQANAARWLEAAAKYAGDPEVVEMLAAATRSHERFRALVHGRNLIAHDREKQARASWKLVTNTKDNDALSKAAAAELKAPRPLRPNESMPSLARYNGIGAGFYGRRDRWDDGSYATTHCFSVVWVPVFPLSAWRVRDQRGGYTIIAREQLSPFARLMRWCIPVAILVSITGFGFNSWLHDPDRLARNRFDEALSAAKSASDDHREAALKGLDDELRDDLYRVDHSRSERAGVEIVRLTASYIANPFTLGQLDQATRLVRRYQALPEVARNGAARDAMLALLEDWTSKLGTGVDSYEARFTLLGHAVDIADADRKPQIAAQISTIRLAAAAAKAADWPLDALAILALEPRGPATVQADAIVARLVDAPSLLVDAGTDFEIWMVETTDDALKTKARSARDLAVTAKQIDEADGVTPKQVAAQLAKQPWDQFAVLQLARNEASAGKLDAASAQLTKLGTPGMMIRDARFLLAQITAAQGKLEDADKMLTTLLGTRLARFVAASAALRDASAALQERLKAQLDNPSPELRSRLGGRDEEDQRVLVDAWIKEQMESDSSTRTAREKYVELGDVVPVSLAAGSIELRRAQALTGPARNAMLEQAEKMFLAIRTEAEGQPEFRMGLGEIYARLGKTKESDAEFAAILDKHDPELSLKVASVYRDIGSMERAKQVAKDVFDQGESKMREDAAQLLGLMANDEDEAEGWYRKADQKSNFVQTSLLEIEGKRLMRQGKNGECAEKFAEAARAHLASTAVTHGAGYNNAAGAFQFRYECSGDLQSLRDAVAALETAYRNSPDDPIVAGNLAGLLSYTGKLGVLGKHVDVRALRLGGNDVDTVLGRLLDGSERDTLLAELAADPTVRRSLELLSQFEVLAPNSPAPFRLRFETFEHTRDADGAAAVVDRARHAKGLDISEVSEQRARWLAGTDDAKYLAMYDNDRARLTQVLAQKTLDAKTRAIALYLLSDALEWEGLYKPDLAMLAACRESAAEALRLWPELGADSTIWDSLLDQAGMTVDPKAWLAQRRVRTSPGATTKLFAENPVFASKMKASPEWAQLPAAAKADNSHRGIGDMQLARLLGDPELEARAKVVFDDKLVRLSNELTLVLAPDDLIAKENLAYLDKR